MAKPNYQYEKRQKDLAKKKKKEEKLKRKQERSTSQPEDGDTPPDTAEGETPVQGQTPGAA